MPPLACSDDIYVCTVLLPWEKQAFYKPKIGTHTNVFLTGPFLIFCTNSNGKLGGAWERGYCGPATAVVLLPLIVLLLAKKMFIKSK